MNITINNKTYSKVKLTKILNFKYNDEFILLKKINYFNTFLIRNIDILFLNEKNSVILKYLNMPKYKSIKVNYDKEKTSILLLPQNASFGIKIGDVLIFK